MCERSTLLFMLNYSPIKMVETDSSGMVSDGPSTDLDCNYQLDLSLVTATFRGFESQLHGVSHYYWAVGSAPALDDVMSYTSADLVTKDDGTKGRLNKMT